MNSIEERDNLIQLMQEALKFYANKNNYEQSKAASSLSMIMLDGGSQAQFAIDQAKLLMEQNQKIQDDYDKLLLEADELEATGETNPLELIRIFTETHQEEDGNSNI